MAYVGKIASGKWQAQVRLPNGKRITRTHKLKSVVEEWARREEEAIDRGRWHDPVTGRRTYAVWREHFMATRTVEADTLRGDKAIMSTHIAPFFDPYELADIRPSTVKQWLARMAKDGVGDSAQVRAFNLFRSSLKAAVADEILIANPADKVEPPRVARKAVEWFTPKQVDALLEQLNDRDVAMSSVMAWCGLRWGEAAGLRVRDVDLDLLRITVQQVVTQSAKVKAYPKNDPSIRTLPMPAHVAGLVAPFCEGKKQNELVFTTLTTGKPLNAANWRKAFYAAEDRAGLPRYTPHVLRHTAASWLVQAGVSLVEVQRLLGHATPVMTNRYAHLAPGAHSAVENAWRAMNPDAPDAKVIPLKA